MGLTGTLEEMQRGGGCATLLQIFQSQDFNLTNLALILSRGRC